jgi:PAS domain S-box-containing protein
MRDSNPVGPRWVQGLDEEPIPNESINGPRRVATTPFARVREESTPRATRHRVEVMGETGLEKYLGSVLDTIAEGIEIIDADGFYSFANLAAGRMFGPREEIIGRRYDDTRWRLVTSDGVPLAREEMPQSQVMRTGEPVLDTLFRAVLPDGRQVVLTMNAVPFRDESGRVVGTLVSYTDVTRRSRTERLDRALLDIGTAVNSSFDFDTILQRALDLAVEALSCESGIIFLKEGSDWVMRFLSNLPEDLCGARVPDELASFTTLTGGKAGAIAFNDAYEDDRISNRVMRRFEIKSLLDVTLRVRGRDIADVSFIYHSSAVPFTEADVAFADKFGAIVGLALESSELYHHEKETARLLQEALLGDPAPIEGIAFSLAYRSGTKSALVGGDFYDLFEIDHDHVGVLLGDVSGKGIAQAMLAARAKHTMVAHLLEGDMPARALELTNHVLGRSTESSTFITAFVGLLDKRSGVLEYCNAGHPDPLVLRSGGDLEELTARSPLLGAFPETEFEPAHASLAAGDVLLLYTDGVTEARGPGGLFGDERIASLLARSAHLSVTGLADHVMKQVADYASGALTDDVAIMAVERADGAPPR